MHALLKSIVVFILTWEAKRVIQKFHPKIIAVSGSVGKTTTKDAIYHLLQERNAVRKSEKSYNGEIGIPLTILDLPNAWGSPVGWLKVIWRGYRYRDTISEYPKVLVIEIGSDHPGDISNVLRWLEPHVVVMTLLPDMPVHVENFSSAEELRQEDSLAVLALKTGGVYVANNDDKNSRGLIKSIEESAIRAVTYGFEKGAMLYGSHPQIRYAVSDGIEKAAGMQFEVMYENVSYPIYVNGILGRQVCSALLAAFATGIAHGESMSRMADNTITFLPPKGRMRIIEGRLGSSIIDDTYNSSPIAVEVALETLKEIRGKRKIALLGDMLELGVYSEAEHWKAGRQAGSFVDEIITVGKRAQWIAEAAKSSGLPQSRIHEFAGAVEAGEFLLSILKTGDVVLAKGSQGSGKNMIRLERAVKIIMAHPEDASTLLVRQEDEWQQQYKQIP